jgi:putrescine aminotransferase
LEHEGLAENAARRGEQLLEGLEDLCRRYRCLRQVRGRGLLLGLEFERLPGMLKSHWLATDPSGLAPYMGREMSQFIDAFHVLHAMQTLLHGHGIYTHFTRSNPQVLRIEPPLTLTESQAQEFLSALDKTCTEIDYIVDLIGEMITKTSLGKHDATERQSLPTAANPG